jgi:hypothetical protein
MTAARSPAPESEGSLDLARSHGVSEEVARANRLLSHIAQELRSPLSTAHQFISVVLDGLAGDVTIDQREYLGIGLRNLERLGLMLDELMEATRPNREALTRGPRQVEIDHLVRETVREWEPLAKTKGVRVVVQIAGGLPLGVADPARVRQALLGRLDEALTVVPKDGTLGVVAALDHASETVRCDVHDFSDGLPAEDKPPAGIVSAETRDLPPTGLRLALYTGQEQGRGRLSSVTVPVYSLARTVTQVLDRCDPSGRGLMGLVVVDVHGRLQSPGALQGWATDVSTVIAETIRNRGGVLLPGRGPTSNGEIFRSIIPGNAEGLARVFRRLRFRLEALESLRAAGLLPRVCTAELELPHEPVSVDQIVAVIVRGFDALTQSEQPGGSGPDV